MTLLDQLMALYGPHASPDQYQHLAVILAETRDQTRRTTMDQSLPLSAPRPATGPGGLASSGIRACKRKRPGRLRGRKPEPFTMPGFRDVGGAMLVPKSPKRREAGPRGNPVGREKGDQGRL